jgi:sialate O-acetylesterase
MIGIGRAASVLVAGLLLGAAAPANAGPLLGEMFQDHAVLQRGKPVEIWGRAGAGDKIAVTIAGAKVKTKAGKDGRWRAMLPPLAAGGPYTLEARDGKGAAQVVNDVLAGDVYLCSGQSNMALTVDRTLDQSSETANANRNTIRMLTVPVSSAPSPRDNFAAPVKWQPATPATVGNFSAACYYFARELQKTVAVPLGLINASSGGSNIRAWTSARALRRAGGYDEELDIVNLYAAEPAAAMRRWAEHWEKDWLARSPAAAGGEPWSATLDDGNWAAAPATLPYWSEWGVAELAGFTGQVWYRTQVTLTAAQAAHAAAISFTLNEEDVTWINGKPVGASFAFGSPRKYAIPAGILHEGRNVVSVNALCTYRGCGIFGAPDSRALSFADGSKVLLDGPWRYRIVPPGLGPAPRAPWGGVAGFGSAYNAMLAPVGGYGLRGALWYQGESNTAETASYPKLLTALIRDWRETFGAGLPVLIVQLPNYGAPPTRPAASGWAEIRETQRQVVAADPHAALAVAIDIGERTDIHPANKQEVGRRLARAARHLIYGEDIPPSGPAAESAVAEGGHIAVRFGGVTGDLVAYGADAPIGFELCGDTQDTCRYAVAAIRENIVMLDVAPGTMPKRVRYCWADSPVCTLYDRSGLPAGPFELKISAP